MLQMQANALHLLEMKKYTQLQGNCSVCTQGAHERGEEPNWF